MHASARRSHAAQVVPPAAPDPAAAVPAVKALATTPPVRTAGTHHPEGTAATMPTVEATGAPRATQAPAAATIVAT